MAERIILRDLRGLPREFTVTQLYVGLDLTNQTTAFDKALSEAKGSVRAYLAAHYDEPIPATNPKVAKVAKAAGVDLDRALDAANVRPAVPAA